MDKLTAIKIKYDDDTYSDEIPISVLSENVEWDNTHTLVDVLGSIDVDAKGTIQDQIDKLSAQITDMPGKIYPIGSIYLSVDETSPASLFGGTWEQLKDRFLLGAGDSYSAGATGGEASHTLTTAEMPSHSHSVNAVKTDNPSANHTHSGTTSSAGSHSHNLTMKASGGPIEGGSVIDIMFHKGGADNVLHTTAAGAHTHSFTTGGVSAWHTHNVPAHNTNASGSDLAHNNMPPYMAVYMWKRVA